MEKRKHRNDLITRIKTIDDKNVIDEIYRLLRIDFDDSLYPISNEQKAEISLARDQISKGEGLDSAQADEEIDKWLKVVDRVNLTNEHEFDQKRIWL